MSSDGIAAIQQRITEIQSRFGTPPVSGATSTAVSANASASASKAGGFSDALSKAVAAQSGQPLTPLADPSTGGNPPVSSAASTAEDSAAASTASIPTASSTPSAPTVDPLSALPPATVQALQAAVASGGAGSSAGAAAASAVGTGTGTGTSASSAVSPQSASVSSRFTSVPARSSPAESTAAATPALSVAEVTGRTAALTPAVKRDGGYDRLQPPAALAKYGNGRIPASGLAPLGTGAHRLYAPAAQAFRQMTADATAAGVRIGVTDSYRPYAEQVDLVRRKGLYSQGGLAARPGTSNHGWGVALDLDLNAKAQEWLRANGHRYGFVEDVPREPWHWTYRPGR